MKLVIVNRLPDQTPFSLALTTGPVTDVFGGRRPTIRELCAALRRLSSEQMPRINLCNRHVVKSTRCASLLSSENAYALSDPRFSRCPLALSVSGQRRRTHFHDDVGSPSLATPTSSDRAAGGRTISCD
jgi:hypothetical protein